MELTQEEARQFPLGMRAHGHCPKHPDQPYYHCPACTAERQTAKGNEILDAHLAEIRSRESAGAGLLVLECPVEITTPAVSQILIFVREFCRSTPKTRLGDLYWRKKHLTGAEAESVQKLIDRLESEGVVAYTGGVYLKVDIDPTGTSGVTPMINFHCPDDLPAFEAEFALFVVSGLNVAVERKNMHFLRGLIVDWVETQTAAGFSLRHRHIRG